MEPLAPSPTARKWWSWDVHPGKHQLSGCGGGSRVGSDFHLGPASLEDLPTPHEVLVLETPAEQC